MDLWIKTINWFGWKKIFLNSLRVSDLNMSKDNNYASTRKAMIVLGEISNILIGCWLLRYLGFGEHLELRTSYCNSLMEPYHDKNNLMKIKYALGTNQVMVPYLIKKGGWQLIIYSAWIEFQIRIRESLIMVNGYIL